MSTKVRKMTPRDVANMLVANGYLHPDDVERVVNNEPPTEAEIEEMKKSSPLWALLKKDVDFNE